MAHRTNLAIQVLSNLPVVVKLENLLQSLYSYFSSSYEHHLEFCKLVEIVETGRLKILQNVNTWWISMLELLKRVMVEYKTRIVNMSQDKVQSKKFLWSSHVVGFVLLATIVGNSECFNQICAKEGCFHLWLCGNYKNLPNKSLTTAPSAPPTCHLLSVGKCSYFCWEEKNVEGMHEQWRMCSPFVTCISWRNNAFLLWRSQWHFVCFLYLVPFQGWVGTWSCR